ncbi:hypothetical protein BSL82_01145 [Tardibacter chloracetimidivorans]|uniref:Uncharacterized protein n=1 Tax=Tardibacter chloracetimidivorans TaxID=1921510 RepID=A0A1L3ZR16_9SPHN|nr:hypothetical protein [Tardibacter chloracetimidivorans]API58071.1 hypothetical protein BSL82_01145 [Tardibacter chloracetimidivorans]
MAWNLATPPHLRRPDDHETTIKTVAWDQYPVAKVLLEACYQLSLIAEGDRVTCAMEKIMARDALATVKDQLSDYRFQVLDDEDTYDPDVLVEGIEVEDAIRKACAIKIADIQVIGRGKVAG